jgi:hypothetical protein
LSKQEEEIKGTIIAGRKIKNGIFDLLVSRGWVREGVGIYWTDPRGEKRSYRWPVAFEMEVDREAAEEAPSPTLASPSSLQSVARDESIIPGVYMSNVAIEMASDQEAAEADSSTLNLDEFKPSLQSRPILSERPRSKSRSSSKKEKA